MQSLLGQLVEMVGDDEADSGGTEAGVDPEPADPFEAWTREFEDQQSAVAEPDDPVLRRLFPNAYHDDPDASAEFRRFTDRDLRDKKITDAEVALGHLEQTNGGALDLQIPRSEAEAWLRSLTSLRLAVATRLGIDDAEQAEQLADLPDDDPRAYLASVYDWLGFAQETLISAL